MNETTEVDMINFSDIKDAEWMSNPDTQGNFNNPAKNDPNHAIIAEYHSHLKDSKTYGAQVAESEIVADVDACQSATEEIKKSIENLRIEISNLDNLISNIESNSSKTLNKDAYILLLKEEKVFFETSIELYEKVNAYITMTYTTIMRQDELMSQYL